MSAIGVKLPNYNAYPGEWATLLDGVLADTEREFAARMDAVRELPAVSSSGVEAALLSDIVSRLAYKPGWTFSLRPGSGLECDEALTYGGLQVAEAHTGSWRSPNDKRGVWMPEVQRPVVPG